MYTGSNPSALRSRKEIVSSFLKILESEPLETITITQIMGGTDLSRQTFYQIFGSKEEIMEYYMNTLLQDYMHEQKNSHVENLCDIAKLFFRFFESYKGTLNLFIKNGKSCFLQKKCREYLLNDQGDYYHLKGTTTKCEESFAITFVISGMVSMLEQWIREPETDTSADELAKLVCRITGD